MLKNIKKLKMMALAYRLACEHDYCPSELVEVDRRDFKGVTQKLLDNYGGNRADEIANMIIRAIEKLKAVRSGECVKESSFP